MENDTDHEKLDQVFAMLQIIQCDEGRIRDEAQIIQYVQPLSDEVLSPIVISFRCLTPQGVLRADLCRKKIFPAESVFYACPGESQAPSFINRGTEKLLALPL